MTNNSRQIVHDHMPPDLARRIAENTKQQTPPPPAKNQDGGDKTKQ